MSYTSELIAIVGESGTGKTRSIMGLPPQETFMITMSGKKPSWMGWKSSYNAFDATTKKGNFFYADSYSLLLPNTQTKSRGLLKMVSEDMKHIKNLIIDDYQYLMADEFMQRAYEKGWDKFTEIARHAYDVLDISRRLRPDLKIFVLSHEETLKSGKRKMKTIGNLLDDKITLEGLFTIVLFTHVLKDPSKERPDFYFQTQTDGLTTAKSPEGMFDKFLIDNDLLTVSKAIDKYNS